MDRDTFGQGLGIVTAFEHTDNFAVGMGLCDFLDHPGQVTEVFAFQAQGTDRVSAVAVKASADHDKLRLDLVGKLFEFE